VEVLHAIAHAAAELMDVPFVSFWIADEAERRLEARAFSDPALAADHLPSTMTYDQGAVGWVATHRRPLEIPDVSADARIIALPWWRARGLTSCLAVPVLLGDRLLAVLQLHGRAPLVLSPEAEDLLDAFAAQSAVALRNAGLFEESERRRRAAEALAGIGHLLSQTFDPPAVAERIAESLRTVVNGLSSSVYRIDENGNLVVMASSTGSATFEWALVLPRGTGIAGLAVQQKAPIASADVLADPRVTFTAPAREYVERSDYRAVLAVPVLVQDRVIGALAVGDRAGRVFDDSALAVARAFADQAAVALENARLFDEADQRRLAAEAAEERYRSLFDRVPVGLFRTMPDGQILDANPAHAQILGYADRDALVGSNVEDHYANPEDRKRLADLLARDGVVRDFEVPLRRRDGSVVWVRLSARAVSDVTGRLLYHEGSLLDVTESRRAAEAERQAESLRRVTQLANAAAHEINNPLAVIVGRLQLLERRFRDTPAVLEHLQQAVVAAKRIAEMIAHMGQITRLEIIEQWSILDLRRSSSTERPKE
jgi:PAS domain S-box-containing protein